MAQVAWPATAEQFILHFGTINPIEWLTSFFMHVGICHLLGNMIFLWAFGIVVEGKVGWWRFLLIYLAIGISESALGQLVMVNSSGDGLGASAAIFGIMAIALVWAPVNNIQCKFFWIVFFYPIVWEFELSILGIALFYLATNFFWAGMSGFAMSSEWAHLMGAVFGGAIGYWMLTSRRVDCEGFDVVAIFKGKLGDKPPPTLAQEREKKDCKKVAREATRQRLNQGLEQFNEYVDQGHYEFALTKFSQIKKLDKTQKMRQSLPGRSSMV